MYHELALGIVNRCGSKEEGQDVLVYGAELIISSLVEIVILLIMGMATKRLLETIVFLGFFCPLRSVCGGYHAPGYRSCTILFSTAFLIMLLFVRPISLGIQLVLLLISSIVIWRMSPVEDSHKPLSAARTKKLCYKSKIYLAVEIVLFGMLYLIFYGEVFLDFIVCSFCCVCILLLIGIIKNSYEGRVFHEKD